jgi:hypothetical protein
LLASPVNAIVVALVSTTDAVIVGAQFADAAVAVNVQVVALPNTVVLDDVS